NGAWLDAQTFPPMTWFVPGILPEGMSLLIGGPKIGKSWLSLDVALAVASGGRALGGVTVGPARPVLLLALEDGDRRLQHRARELLGEDPIPELLNYLTEIEHGQVLDTIAEWLDQINNFVDPLVILDTLGKAMPRSLPGETDYQRDYRVAGGLKRLCDRRAGMALLALHHDRKAESSDFVDAVSGTNGIAGAADSILVLSRQRTEETGLLKVTGRDVEEREYAMTLNGGHWTVPAGGLEEAAKMAADTKATHGLGDRAAEVLTFVAKHPEGVSPSQVGEGLNLPDARRYLSRLLDAGRITRPTRGLYKPRVTSVPSVPFDEDDPGNGTHGTDGTPPPPCLVCGFPLPTVLADEGATTHPSCDQEGEDAC
ncbi:MAG: AAA family ATPase, partial [Propionibacteriaceae bacterium]|nr:AAA family ATPase [Propionibacteriaceae bacterium]